MGYDRNQPMTLQHCTGRDAGIKVVMTQTEIIISLSLGQKGRK